LGELKLFVQKLRLSLSDVEVPDNYDQNFVRSEFRSVLGFSPVSFAVVFALFGGGVLLLGGRPASSVTWLLFALASVYALSLGLFYVTDRYRLPIVVFMFPLAGAMLDGIFNRKTRRQARVLSVTTAVALFGCSRYTPGFYRPHDDVYNRGTIAVLFSEAQKDDKAIEAVGPILNHPEKWRANVLIRVAESFERRGDLSSAEQLFSVATVQYPNDGLTFHNYGRFALDHDRIDVADRLQLRPQHDRRRVKRRLGRKS
jgi:hypothetical protein